MGKIAAFCLSIFTLNAAAQTSSSKATEPIKALNIQTRVVKSSKDTAAAFDEALESLRKKLASEKNAKKRYGLLADSVSELSRLQAGPRPASEEKALEMALVLETFEGLPVKNQYDPGKCASLYAGAQRRMGNMSGDEPEDPGVTKGLEILKLTCGN